MNRLGILLLFLLLVAPAYATKECPPPPCRNSKRELDPALCSAKADWIVVGTLTRIVHDRQAEPLTKDFVSFELKIERCEKGCPQPALLKFKVGWCYNQRELPDDTSGEFRFFGVNAREPIRAGAQYLDFERIGAGFPKGEFQSP